MKNKKVIMISACALILVVLTLVSVGMNLIGPKNSERKEESIVQFMTSGGPDIRINS